MSNTEEAILLDSVILIDLLNGIEKAQTYCRVNRDSFIRAREKRNLFGKTRATESASHDDVGTHRHASLRHRWK